ncbi:MAG: hypothetical protein J7K84_09045 [Deltaproteobacteria bacterium]|nr:hypothetical protein [Deltaproteobacteria bacterium]
MPTKPILKFFINNINNPVTRESRIWKKCLPVSRNMSVKQIKTKSNQDITYGDYFQAIGRFFKDDSFADFLSVIPGCRDMDIGRKNITEISVYLIKHGAFYHPSRVEFQIENKQFCFILNVALSTFGRTTLLKEYNVLQKLKNNFSFSFLPVIYKYGEVSLSKIGQNETDPQAIRQKAGLLLGEWLEGFNEFHLTTDPDNQKKRIIVWDSLNGNYYLSTAETLELYKQATMILTCYYNIKTFEQIFPWHHAAGDFVVKKKNDKIYLKLVTARQYASMLGQIANSNRHETEPNAILEGLLIFFLNLSIRMRLDRLDGVGNTVWANEVAVAGTFKGFMNGLALKSENNIFPEALDKYFKDLFLSFTVQDILDLLINIVTAYDPQSSEIPVIKQNLNNHAEILHHVINQ